MQRIDFSIERDRHRDFLGRAALLARLDHLLVADRTDRWVVVIGGPGMGKSAILAAWLARREAAGAAVPHHFIRRGTYGWDDPVKLVDSLVAQIQARLPDQRESVEDAELHPAARLAAMLTRVSTNVLVPHGERLVILIDGLDEYDLPAGSHLDDPLNAFLPHALPRGVSFLCASRPRHPYLPMLEARDGTHVAIDLDASDQAADNTATVHEFWKLVAPRLGLDAQFIEEAVACAAGNLQHAVTLQKHLEGLPDTQRRVESLPRGLEALLVKLWQRVATDPIAVNSLGILCAAREALTLDELGTVAGWTGVAQREAFVHAACEFLLETRREPVTSHEPVTRRKNEFEYRLHHESIREHVASRIGPTALRRHHAELARKLASWPALPDPVGRRYALHHALAHRVEARDWTGAWRLVAELSFLEAKCHELGAHAAEMDVFHAAKCCREAGEQTIGQRLEDVARVLARWSRNVPETVTGLVWNRLRTYGWTSDDLDEHLRVPSDAMFLRVRYVSLREAPALVREFIGHTAGVRGCSVTPDGRRVISASSDRTLKVWELDTGRVLATLAGHNGAVSACAVSRDGRRAVSASFDGTLKIWDLDGGRVLVTLSGHRSPVNACAVTPDGRVVSASDDGTLRLWDLDTGGAVAAFWPNLRDPESRVEYNYPVNACAVTPDGRFAISAHSRGGLTIYDLDGGNVLVDLQGHDGSTNTCLVTPDGGRLVSGSGDQTLKVWDLGSRRALTGLVGHTAWVSACAVTPDGQRLISASGDRTLKVWDLDTGGVLATFEGHNGWVRGCAVTPDGRRVISASEDRTLRVWDLHNRRAPAIFDGHTGLVTSCAVTPDCLRVITASEDKTLKVWDLATGRVVATLNGHDDCVITCAVTPDGRHVVSGSRDGYLFLWDLDTGNQLKAFGNHGSWVTACAVMPDGQRVVAMAGNLRLCLWDLHTGAELLDSRAYYGLYEEDGAIGTYPRPMCFACAVTVDGRVVYASDNPDPRVWNPTTDRFTRLQGGNRRHHAKAVSACALTPDGKRVVTASKDRTLKVWDLDAGRILATLEGHTGSVNAGAVTPDGRRVVSASADNTLKLWDLETHACLVTHHGDNAFTSVATTHNGVIAGDATGTVWFLDLPMSLRSAGPRRVSGSDGAASTQACAAVGMGGPHEQVAARDQTAEIHMTRVELLTRLLGLFAPIFDEVLFRAGIPPEYLPSNTAPQATRAMDVIRYFEQQNKLEQLARTIDDVVSAEASATGSGLDEVATPDARAGKSPRGAPTQTTSPSPEPPGTSAPSNSRRRHSATPRADGTATSTPDAATHRDPAERERPFMTNPDLPEGTEFPATVVFVVIQGLKDCSDAPQIPGALRALNEALRGVDAGSFVLSTITGVIVVVPDTVTWNADDTSRALDQATVGFRLRVGVTHGTVEVVRDIDDEPNLIGPPINIAARLATSPENPGLLAHESYAGFVDATLSASHWLHRSVRQATSIAGKPQDPTFVCFPGPQTFAAKGPAPAAPSSPRPAVLVAYDLPKFSAGDRAQLRKRFTRLAHVFQKLRQSAPMQTAAALLSPGGDGGVLVLKGVNLPDAAAVASRLQTLTEIESLDHDEAIAVEIRIAVHYGPVAHYVNARGIERPTGLSVFVADEIAGDEHARARKGIILTRLLADSLAGGSSQRLASEFERLPKLTSGPASGVERFVKAGHTQARPDTRAPSPHPSGHQPSPQAAQTRMTRDDLLMRLSRLLPSQFEEVLFRAKVPTAHLPGSSAPQAARAIDAIRHLEQQNQLDQLARILEAVATGPS